MIRKFLSRCALGAALLSAVLSLTTVSAAAEAPLPGFAGHKVLVAYFSRARENPSVGKIERGNTAMVAEDVAALTGGTLFEIKPAKQYPASYAEAIEVAEQERKTGARPELAADLSAEEFSQYDVIALGYPIWWGDLPMAVYTFLNRHEFKGKTVLPFLTHEGSGESGTTKSIMNALPGATVIPALPIQGQVAHSDERERRLKVRAWLEEVKLPQAK